MKIGVVTFIYNEVEGYLYGIIRWSKFSKYLPVDLSNPPKPLAAHVGSGSHMEPSPISPYLCHLYDSNKCLTGQVREEVPIAKNMQEVGLDSKEGMLEALEEAETKQESLTHATLRKLLQHAIITHRNGRARMKNTINPRNRSTPTQACWHCKTMMSSFVFLDDPFQVVNENVREL